MYAWMMTAAVSEPSTTYATLSALMQPAVPYFIVVNTLMEALIVPLVIFLNWQTPMNRRAMIIVAVLVYFAMRVWTYLIYAPMRLDISTQPLTAADVEWFRQTLATDTRVVLNVITHILLICAAFIPAALSSEQTVESRQAPSSGAAPAAIAR
jgi:hypothetical protein